MLRPEFEDLDGGSVAAEVVLLRDAADKAIMIVEGPSDCRLLDKFVDPGACELVIAHGRENLLSASDLIDGLDFQGVLSLIDKDYDDVAGVDRVGPNRVVTVERDMECYLFKSAAFEAVLCELGSRSKIRALAQVGTDFRKRIVDATTPLGLLRAHSARERLDLKFSSLDYSFIDRRSLAVDVKALAADVWRKSRRPGTPPDDWERLFDLSDVAPQERDALCRGHDLTAVLAIALRSLLGTLSAREATRETVEAFLRASYSFDEFTGTDLFEALHDWENRNPPYRLFPNS